MRMGASCRCRPTVSAFAELNLGDEKSCCKRGAAKKSKKEKEKRGLLGASKLAITLVAKPLFLFLLTAVGDVGVVELS